MALVSLKEPLKTCESLEKTLVELMTMKTALLEDQFQNALTSQAGKSEDPM